MSNVIKLYPRNAADSIDNVFELAVGCFDTAIIVGYDKKGELDVRADTSMTAEKALFALEIFKQKLLSGDYFE